MSSALACRPSSVAVTHLAMRLPRFAASLLMIATAFACTEKAEDDDTSAGAGGSSHAAGGAAGAGGSAGGAAPVCDMWGQRELEPEVLIGPTGLRDQLIAHIDSASTSIELMMYQLECAPCVDALIAAHNRGVAVRVMLDGEQTVNDGAQAALASAGVPVQTGPAELNHNHAKVLILDRVRAVVMSANMNGYSFSSERNYGVVDHDPQDVDQLRAIFDRDWSGAGAIDTSCTRLIVSPLNARPRLLELINSATETLDFGVMYISDPEVRNAIETKIDQGVAVRVLLAMPEWIDSNAATAQRLSAAGAETRYLYTFELHAKLVVADGVPFVGSENFSTNALDNNREIGLLVTESAPAAQINQQFEADWVQGVAAP